jgi:hypothetical protein
MSGSAFAQDPLPSWNDGPVKKAILEFVVEVTNEKGKDYVEPAERIVTFESNALTGQSLIASHGWFME